MNKIRTALAYATLAYCGIMTVACADMWLREANAALDDWLTEEK